ncbi:uncharacterized protein TRIREDRAFT_109345 [Trichoderma reesei QM6a]|uniref:Predicted protein n=1 Tax=Hypocrea jecorina (strain QM6a) TaxID=431241 RepID=G0RPF5_HYPJQ|nr:uncharacterized protein TRIREDRAFT_109345 [Trichoderma reesei QM6a]EGR46997.1 predicted protein [Trichoderma reesei QM6a]
MSDAPELMHRHHRSRSRVLELRVRFVRVVAQRRMRHPDGCCRRCCCCCKMHIRVVWDTLPADKYSSDHCSMECMCRPCFMSSIPEQKSCEMGSLACLYEKVILTSRMSRWMRGYGKHKSRSEADEGRGLELAPLTAWKHSTTYRMRRAVRVRCPRRPVFVTARNWGCDIAREVVRHDETETDPQKLAIKTFSRLRETSKGGTEQQSSQLSQQTSWVHALLHHAPHTVLSIVQRRQYQLASRKWRPDIRLGRYQGVTYESVGPDSVCLFLLK